MIENVYFHIPQETHVFNKKAREIAIPKRSGYSVTESLMETLKQRGIGGEKSISKKGSSLSTGNALRKGHISQR